jgi:hypothetical protein
MSFSGITDEKIEAFLKMPKRLLNPKSKKKSKYGHDEWEYEVEAKSEELKFRLYKRQSQTDQDDFSCGLTVYLPGGQELTLVRYNGASHPHRNPIEKSRFAFRFHIHRATERYIDYKGGHSPEKYAEVTDKYTTLEEALTCLLTDCCIQTSESQDLFGQ